MHRVEARKLPEGKLPEQHGARVQGLEVLVTPEAKACLFLGLPATVTHVIDASSPLADLSLAAMASWNMQARP